MASSDGARDQGRGAELHPRAGATARWPSAITLKWVFKLKKGELGAVIKHKAKLVAHGFV